MDAVADRPSFGNLYDCIEYCANHPTGRCNSVTWVPTWHFTCFAKDANCDNRSNTGLDNLPLIESAYLKSSRRRRSHDEDRDVPEGGTKIENTSMGYLSSTCLSQMPAILRSGISQDEAEYKFRACANQVIRENDQRLTSDIIKERVFILKIDIQNVQSRASDFRSVFFF